MRRFRANCSPSLSRAWSLGMATRDGCSTSRYAAARRLITPPSRSPVPCARRFILPHRTWALFAALHNHDPAIFVLTQTLLSLTERMVESARRGLDGLERSRTLRREAIRARRLALDWGRRIGTSILHSPGWWREQLMQPTPRETADRETASIKTSEGRQDLPSLLVVKEIGFPETEEASIVTAYEALTEPLPLRGGAVDPKTLSTALSLEFPHLSDAIGRIVQDLLLLHRSGVPWAKFRAMLLIGPPGIGKTRFARRVARLLGTGCGEIGVGGVSDNRLLEGTARGWRDAQPCWPLLVMRQMQAANPVLLVDEIDKAVGSHNGDVRATLLGMLEVETARSWYDACLLAPADLSQISWILTANNAVALPRPLLSRLRVVRVEAPESDAFDGLLEGVLRDIADELSIARVDLPTLSDEVEARLRAGFAAGAGIRALERAVEAALAQAQSRPRRMH
jgi:hypothetical protein